MKKLSFFLLSLLLGLTAMALSTSSDSPSDTKIGSQNKANNLEQIVSKNTDPGNFDTEGKFKVVNYLISKDRTTPLNKSENKLLSKYLENIAKRPNDLSIEQCLAVANAIETHPYNKSTETEQKVLSSIRERQLNLDEIMQIAQFYKSKNDVANVDYYMNKAESIFSKYPTVTTLFYNLINAYQSIYGDDKTVEMVARFYPKYAKSKYKDEKNLQIGRDMQQILIKGGRTDVVVKQFEESLDKQTITGAALVDNYVSIKMLNNSSDDVNRVANKLKDRIVSSGESKNAVGEIINALYKNHESLGNEADEILTSIKFNNQNECENALGTLLDRGYKDALAWSYPILIQNFDSVQDEELLNKIIVTTGGGSFVVGDFKYQNLGKTVSAEYIGNSSTVTFPTEVTSNDRTYPVSSIKGVSIKDNIVSVVIPNGIEKISENAFDGCEKLTTVTIPASKIQIGKLAFANCPALTTITNLNFTKDIDDPEQSWDYFLRTCYKSIKMLDTFYKQLIAKYTQDNLYKSANRLLDGYLEGEYYWYIERKNYGCTSSHEMGSRVLLNIAAKGNIKAMRDICYYYIKLEMNYGGPITAADYLKYAKLLITKKPAWGYFYMGMAYEFGLGVTPSRSTAHSYYAKGRELNDSDCIKGWNRTW
jgi:hypothetical protein